VQNYKFKYKKMERIVPRVDCKDQQYYTKTKQGTGCSEGIWCPNYSNTGCYSQ